MEAELETTRPVGSRSSELALGRRGGGPEKTGPYPISVCCDWTARNLQP